MWDLIHFSPTPPQYEPGNTAAVLAPLFEDEAGEVRIILTKRPDTMPTHAGHIAFPGGRPHPGDRGPVDTALREAEEEIGIDRAIVEVLGFLPPIDTVEFTPMVVPVVGRVTFPFELVPSEREVARVYTPRLADLADNRQWWFVPWGHRRIWYYTLEGDTLWGATAMMIRQLLGMAQ